MADCPDVARVLIFIKYRSNDSYEGHVRVPYLYRSLSNFFSRNIKNIKKSKKKKENSFRFSRYPLKPLHGLKLSEYRSRRASSIALTMASSSLIRFCVLASVLFSASFFEIYAEEAAAKEFVITLDNSNFSDVVSKHNFIVVEFYAPWYGFLLLSFGFLVCHFLFVLVKFPSQIFLMAAIWFDL